MHACSRIHVLYKTRPLFDKYLLRTYCVKVFRLLSMDNTKMLCKTTHGLQTLQPMPSVLSLRGIMHLL